MADDESMIDTKLYYLKKCLVPGDFDFFSLTVQKDKVHDNSSEISDEDDDDEDDNDAGSAGSDLLKAKGGGSNKVQPDYVPDTARDCDWSQKLPQIFLSNVRSINNKEKEFQELMEGNEEYKACDLVCLTETWLQETSKKDIFKSFKVTFRRDRDLEKTEKSDGGGLTASSNGRLKRLKGYSLENHELMAFSYKADDHIVNHPPIIFMLVYLSGNPAVAEKKKIEEKIKQRYQHYLKKYNSGPVFLLGDFNQYDFLDLPATTDPNARMVQQYVTCPTRKGAILDKCYGNVQDAYSCQKRKPLGKSDHNVILLIPNKPSARPESCTHAWRREAAEEGQ